MRSKRLTDSALFTTPQLFSSFFLRKTQGWQYDKQVRLLNQGSIPCHTDLLHMSASQRELNYCLPEFCTYNASRWMINKSTWVFYSGILSLTQVTGKFDINLSVARKGEPIHWVIFQPWIRRAYNGSLLVLKHTTSQGWVKPVFILIPTAVILSFLRSSLTEDINAMSNSLPATILNPQLSPPFHWKLLW